MDVQQQIKKAMGKALFWALLGLFALPVFSLWFAEHVLSEWNQEIRGAMAEGSSVQLDAANLSALPDISFYCGHVDPAIRKEVCGFFSDPWQMYWADRVAIAAILVGLLTIGIMAWSAWWAKNKRGAELTAFSFGWTGLRATTAISVFLQGLLLAWLSYWLTAYFMNVYVPKLIVVAVIAAAVATYMVIAAIFKRVKSINNVSGMVLSEAQAPQLWLRVRQFAGALRTEAPQQIIVGIDCNFFVTQMPLTLGDGQVLTGRSLFLSIPLLRWLAHDEADAVLAHELAHFAGGDTQYSAALGPKLEQFNHYITALEQSLAVIVVPILNLFRASFEFVLQSRSREREFAADSIAAQVTSPRAIATSLVKVAAYANYRGRVEAGLFEARQQHHGALGIGQQVMQGLQAFTQSPQFHSDMQDCNTPHPFDSHPPLPERMQNVGHVIAPEHYSAVTSAMPTMTWAAAINNADQIEQQLWAQFEQQFANEHAEMLPFRSDPNNPAERDIVLSRFPDISFPIKSGGAFLVSAFGMQNPADGSLVEWDRVQALQYNDGSFTAADSLLVTHPEKRSVIGNQTTTIKLKVSKEVREAIKESIGQYWHRHQVMRAFQASGAASAGA